MHGHMLVGILIEQAISEIMLESQLNLTSKHRGPYYVS